MMNRQSPIGMNLANNKDWTSELKPADQFKTSRPWVSGTLSVWDDSRAIALDSHGWPRSTLPNQICKAVMAGWRGLHLVDGEYVVTYTGNGDGGRLIYGGRAALVTSKSRPGRHVVQVTSGLINGELDGSWWIGLQNIDVANPIRDIRVAPPGHADQLDNVMFNHSFADRLAPWSTIRFMQCCEITRVGDDAVNWAERSQMTDSSWWTKGLPYEAVIKLCNEQMCDAWICVPLHANDDFVAQMARMFRDTLDPGLRIHVEYSNEIWNGAVYVKTYTYLRDQGLNRNYGRNAQGMVDPNLAALQYYGQRTAEIGDIWVREFGPSWATRVSRVIGGQSSSAWPLMQAMAFVVPGTSLPIGSRVDEACIAPYLNWRFPPGTAAQAQVTRLNGLTVDQLWAETGIGGNAPAAGTLLSDCFAGIAANKAVIARYPNVRMTAYEGGQHFTTPPNVVGVEQLEATFNVMNLDDRMITLYGRLHDEWKRQSGQLFMAFVNCDVMSVGGRGRFGILRWMDEPNNTAPKRRALESWAAAHPKWW